MNDAVTVARTEVDGRHIDVMAGPGPAIHVFV